MQTVEMTLLSKLAHVHGYGEAPGTWTFDDLKWLPDDTNCYEIIEGKLYVTTMVSGFHQWSIMGLVENIGLPAKSLNMGYSFFAPLNVFMPSMTPVQPDFFFIRAENAAIMHDRYVYGTPDLIVEVLSPSSSSNDLEVKYKAYARAGVPEYGIIDPRARTLILYRLVELGSYEQVSVYGEADTVTFACLPTILLRVGDLFAGAPDTTV